MIDVEIADLAEIGLPLLDEPNHPRLGQYTKQHTKDWSAIIDRAELDELLRLESALHQLRTPVAAAQPA